MKKITTFLFAAIFLVSFTFGQATPADAAAKSYKNCTELNKVYKGGVAKSKNIKNKGGKTKYAPFVSAELYAANSSKDRDKDGIACER